MSDCKVILTWKENGVTVHAPGSNFWTTEDGFNVEVEFQAEKHAGHPMRQKIIRLIGYTDGPGAAKAKGREWRLTANERREWDGRKLEVMRDLTYKKAVRSPLFREWLLETGDKMIVEDNWWHDQFWGNCLCREKRCVDAGSNWLGHILHDLRRIVTPQGVRDLAPSARRR